MFCKVMLTVKWKCLQVTSIDKVKNLIIILTSTNPKDLDNGCRLDTSQYVRLHCTPAHSAQQCTAQWTAKCTVFPEGIFLDKIQTEILRVFLLAIHRHLH